MSEEAAPGSARAFLVFVAGRTHRVTAWPSGQALQISVDGAPPVAVDLRPLLGSTHFRLAVGATTHVVEVRRRGAEWVVTVGADRAVVRVEPDLPVARRVRTGGPPAAREIRAPMPGLVVAVEVTPGAAVEQGQAVVIMEAMKMQMEIRAPSSGRVRAVHVSAGQDVAGGTVLVTLDPGE
ncbi:MAG: biotin/lipoyl-containing protein [Armatimonadota bacterium]|nr:biotin/lipoyl-containing protein [Armatimonadota bacterium]MDR7401585.1 biotin/lipoyl-containing protein [Armatimonadota bacterium]MDR7403326.1 biotin/lipoyl-containing protein [Armatimonadota bacterium]MDR7436852.1 biotin/lipoyl-containing protein [Armatimonadota bacterium]MDR7471607.1 biotin/lipoyl-containing protein [Armatimonadota bacterium]